MFFLGKCALVAPILLLVLISLKDNNVAADDKEAVEKFYKNLNETITNEEVRAKVRYFLEHYPFKVDDEFKNKTKRVQRALFDQMGGVKSKGKDRFVVALGAAITTGVSVVSLLVNLIGGGGGSEKPADTLENSGICRDACSCRDPDRCLRPQCPPLPPDQSKCAQYPICHPACRLELILMRPPVAPTMPPTTTTTAAPTTSTSTSTTTTTTTSTTTTKAPTTTTATPTTKVPATTTTPKSPSQTKAPKLATTSSPRGSQKFEQSAKQIPGNNTMDPPHIDNLINVAECCYKCAKTFNFAQITQEVCGAKKHKRIIVKDKAKYNFVGQYKFHKSLEASKLNLTMREEVTKIISAVDVNKYDEKLFDAATDILRYFDDRELRRGNPKNRQGFDWGQAVGNNLGTIIQTGGSIVGHLIDLFKKKETHIACKCPMVSCPPLSLSECEGACPNNPGCPIGQCRCFTGMFHQAQMATPLIN